MQYLLSFIFPILSFTLQTYPRFFNKYFGVDVWTRLLEIEHVKKSGHRIPKNIKKGFIIDGEFDYPIIFPWLFSFFPKKTLLRYQGFVSPFFDAIQNFLIFFIAYYLTGNTTISMISQAMYSVIPIIPIENSYLTPRSLGYLNFTLAYFPIFLYHSSGNLFFLLISLFFTSTLFLTHRFALQSFIFVSLFFSVVDLSIIYILNLIFSFLIVLILTKGFYLRVLRGHLYNIYFWVINYRYRFSHQIYGLKHKKRADWVGKIYSLLPIFSPIFLFVINIWAFFGIAYFLIYLGIIKIPGISLNAVFSRMSLWILFFYIFGAIVLKIKRLIPIGEGQRYMEMASVPSVILSSLIFYHLYNRLGISILLFLIFLLLANIAIILFVQTKGIITDKNRSLTKDLSAAYNYINKMKKTPRILCIPHQITTMTVYNTKADVLVNADNKGLMQIQKVYPVLTVPISYLQKKYSLDFILLRESYSSLNDLKIPRSKIIFQSGDVLLAKLK